MKRVVDEMGAREVTIAYGMTETSPVSFQSHGDDSLERRVTTVGRVHPHTEVKIVDPETGATVPSGHVGELCTRGYRVMLGYWDDAARHGGQHRRRAAGCIPATSRRSTRRATATSSAASRTWSSAAARTSIRARSRNSSTATPQIQAVQVFGVPDARYGEELCAWIVRAAGRVGDRRRDPGFLPGPDRALQDPALCRIRRRVPDDRDRQGAEIPHAGAMIERLGLASIKTA